MTKFYEYETFDLLQPQNIHALNLMGLKGWRVVAPIQDMVNNSNLHGKQFTTVGYLLEREHATKEELFKVRAAEETAETAAWFAEHPEAQAKWLAEHPGDMFWTEETPQP